MKIRLTILVLVCILSIMTSLTKIVHGEPVSFESKATITFEQGDGAPTVLDPSDPTKPYTPGENDPEDDPTGNTGPLTLDYVSSVHFGEQKIESKDMVYESTILRPFIQVTDRRGTGAGWQVTAQLSEFNSEGNPTLPGAVLTFRNGTVISPCLLSDEPTPAEEIILYAGGPAAPVVTAEPQTGLGTWITRWFPTSESALNDSVTLEIPAGAATIDTHSATITWTLSDAPGH